MSPLAKIAIGALAIVTLGFTALYVLEPWLPGPEPIDEIVEHGSAGPFWIGMDRASALAAATALGAEEIMVDLRYDQTYGTYTPDGVDKFARAEVIIVNSGAIWIRFSGDQVASINVSPGLPREHYGPFLDGVTTREEALAALRRLLAAYRARAFMTIDKPPVRIGDIGETETVWLNYYDYWGFRARSVRDPKRTDS